MHYRVADPGTALGVDFHAGGMVFLWVALVARRVVGASTTTCGSCGRSGSTERRVGAAFG